MKNIRNSKYSKILASYLAIQMLIMTIQPTNLFALTGGPSQPEFNSFTPIGTSDMVNLSSGDFNYNIPIMDVGGYPLNLAYDSGITMDQEASWVGLGWNLNVGQINRQVRGIPDDFNGDEIVYTNNLKDNKTVGMTIYGNTSALAFEPLANAGLNLGLTIQQNNYDGVSAIPSLGFSFDLGNAASVGMNFSGSATDGPTVTPTVGISKKNKFFSKLFDNALISSVSIATPYNSRQGLMAFNINTSISYGATFKSKPDKNGKQVDMGGGSSSLAGIGLTFNDLSFTPQKRLKMHTNSFTGDLSFGGYIWGFAIEGGITGFGTVQRLAEKVTPKKAYGYEFGKNASVLDILDFNRENDNVANKNTKVLPTVNYTYDIYSVRAQGNASQFRPFKSQVGYVFDEGVIDESASTSVSGEVEVGLGIHVGANFKRVITDSHTGAWNTTATKYFKPVSSTKTKLDYEETYFKSTGDLSVDSEQYLFQNSSNFNHLGGENAIALKIVGSKHNRKATNTFREQVINNDGTASDSNTSNAIENSINITDKLYRKQREKRNQVILKVNKKEAADDSQINLNLNLEDHHTNGVKILNDDGATYVYGEALVNLTKKEVTFASEGSRDLKEGTITLLGNENENNENGIDHYYNKIETPEYAHTFLLSSVLSSDYEDLTGNGPTDDDLGAYTKFHYDNNENNSANYKWRVPFTNASYNPGLYTKTSDQKGSYVYGEKEIKYVSKIETKTHVAIFDLTERRDGYGVNNVNGGLSTASKMYKINTISLYSKPEYIKFVDGDNSITPIKVAHFEYDYALAGTKNNTRTKLPNNSGISELVNGVDINAEKGKLTLKKVYFTYRDSNMGKYTPYTFNYDNINPAYQVKSYDIWGNYKPLFEGDNYVTLLDIDQDGILDDVSTSSPTVVNPSNEVNYPITAQEFPFVQQKNKELQDLYAAAWTLSSINLPSGGRIEMNYESDDYQYVQNLKAMQMFKVAGVARENQMISGNETFDLESLYIPGAYGVTRDVRYIVVELENESSDIPVSEFIEKYIGVHIDKPIYFKFLLNMVKNATYQYDYVSGYFNIDKTKDFKVFTDNNKVYAAVPMQFTDLEGGINGQKKVNPISKAGWFFGRSYLNRFTVGIGDDNPESLSLIELINSLGASFASFAEFVSGPNGRLRNNKQIARKFKKDKSFIRLQKPGNKFGGGLRVAKIEMFDEWETMTTGNVEYGMSYGQNYNYNLTTGLSSGVATFEPNACRENPFVEPFYNGGERIMAPKESNYVEKPFGASFFPSPTVTYSRVEVENLPRTQTIGGVDVNLKKHATGRVVNEFITSKDFPTKVAYTNIDGAGNYDAPNTLAGNDILGTLLNLTAQTHLTLSQGFSIITNDMNGKTARQEVFDEKGSPVSSIEYIYNKNQNGELDNNLPVIKKDGSITNALIGTQYDVVTDFRENYSYTRTVGANVNLELFPPSPWPWLVGIVLPNRSKVENIYRSTTTTKVIHKTGILKEKIAKDLGATVSTRNLAWDATSGQVLLTETINEYDDNYYNFTYPAHWAYKNMGQAVENLGIEAWLSSANVANSSQIDNDTEGTTSWYKLDSATLNDATLSAFFAPGDEVLVYKENGDPVNPGDNRYWVNQIKTNNNGQGQTLNENMILINRNGHILNPCGEDPSLGIIKIKVVRSHNRNLQSASMASVTSMTNPMLDNVINANDYSFDQNSSNNPRIINASAVEYKDFWRPQNELLKMYQGQFNGGPGAIFAGVSNTSEAMTGSLASYPEDSALINDLVPYPKNYFNPFVNNIKGDWRAVKSYAYLTGRTNNSSPRNDGFFTSFNPFYVYDGNTGVWGKQTTNWTYASEVTKYSPFGAELENRDALNRYSSAQYGYGYTLPIAVASNSKYHEMGYDGLEDYNNYDDGTSGNIALHFGFRNASTSTGVNRVTNEAHTGKYSLKVNGGETATAILVNSSAYMPSSAVLPEIDCIEPCPSGCSGTFPDCDCETEESPECGNLFSTNVTIGAGGTVSFDSVYPGLNITNMGMSSEVLAGAGCSSCNVSINSTGFYVPPCLLAYGSCTVVFNINTFSTSDGLSCNGSGRSITFTIVQN